jgi:hypothetical protein
MRALTEKVIDGSYDGMYQFEFGLDLLLNSVGKMWVSAKKAD